jgi:hypothetical protein
MNTPTPGPWQVATVKEIIRETKRANRDTSPDNTTWFV